MWWEKDFTLNGIGFDKSVPVCSFVWGWIMDWNKRKVENMCNTLHTRFCKVTVIYAKKGPHCNLSEKWTGFKFFLFPFFPQTQQNLQRESLEALTGELSVNDGAQRCPGLGWTGRQVSLIILMFKFAWTTGLTTLHYRSTMFLQNSTLLCVVKNPCSQYWFSAGSEEKKWREFCDVSQTATLDAVWSQPHVEGKETAWDLCGLTWWNGPTLRANRPRQYHFTSWLHISLAVTPQWYVRHCINCPLPTVLI